jgi:hypothetical protein
MGGLVTPAVGGTIFLSGLLFKVISLRSISKIGEIPMRGKRATFRLPCRVVYVPSWFPPVLFGLPVLVWLLIIGWCGLQHERRLKSGRCTKCGYQLLDENRYCPESGATPDGYSNLNPVHADQMLDSATETSD